MSDTNERKPKRARRIRHKGRGSQVLIYLGKQLRFFINENDWKVLPMAAVIAALVGMVIRRRFFINMEGSLIGAFALTCVAIWNGCFNSIQAVCRERAIIKREHRSGMHVSAYVLAHMIYQLLLCAAQTALTMYVLRLLQVQIPAKGFITPWMIVDIGISMLLITYAADMMSLFLSSVSRTTTGAMTLMPFVLIFQLVFSGGIIPLPAWSQSLSNYTISNYGIRVLAAQSGYNELPMVTAWNTLSGMRNREVGGTVTLGEVMDFLNSPGMETYRQREVIPPIDLKEMILDLARKNGLEELAAAAFEKIAPASGTDLPEKTPPIYLGDLIDLLNGMDFLKEKRDLSFTAKTTVGELLNVFGEERVRDLVQTATAKASFKPEYDRVDENIIGNWMTLGLFILLFALLAVIALELIDKDKR